MYRMTMGRSARLDSDTPVADDAYTYDYSYMYEYYNSRREDTVFCYKVLGSIAAIAVVVTAIAYVSACLVRQKMTDKGLMHYKDYTNQ